MVSSHPSAAQNWQEGRIRPQSSHIHASLYDETGDGVSKMNPRLCTPKRREDGWDTIPPRVDLGYVTDDPHGNSGECNKTTQHLLLRANGALGAYRGDTAHAGCGNGAKSDSIIFTSAVAKDAVFPPFRQGCGKSGKPAGRLLH